MFKEVQPKAIILRGHGGIQRILKRKCFTSAKEENRILRENNVRYVVLKRRDDRRLW